MIDQLSATDNTVTQAKQAGGGFSKKASIERRLSEAVAFDGSGEKTSAALAYAMNSYDLRGADKSAQAQQSLGFGDFLDIVNPLHHIPVVSHLYREASGDHIHPAGKIVGGAIFGGPLGAVSGLVNVIAERETGKDLAGNAIALVTRKPSLNKVSGPAQHPEARLNEAVRVAKESREDLPASLLAFTAHPAAPEESEEKREPSHFSRKMADPREPITTFDKAFPLRNYMQR